jgi:hypothetical protein
LVIDQEPVRRTLPLQVSGIKRAKNKDLDQGFDSEETKPDLRPEECGVADQQGDDKSHDRGGQCGVRYELGAAADPILFGLLRGCLALGGPEAISTLLVQPSQCVNAMDVVKGEVTQALFDLGLAQALKLS